MVLLCNTVVDLKKHTLCCCFCLVAVLHARGARSLNIWLHSLVDRTGLKYFKSNVVSSVLPLRDLSLSQPPAAKILLEQEISVYLYACYMLVFDDSTIKRQFVRKVVRQQYPFVFSSGSQLITMILVRIKSPSCFSILYFKSSITLISFNGGFEIGTNNIPANFRARLELEASEL